VFMEPDQRAYTETTDESFVQEVEFFAGWCAVEFYTSWCIPCRKFSDIVWRVAAPFQSEVKLFRHDVDRGLATADRYVVYAVPALYVFSQGVVRGKLLGYHPEEEVREFFARFFRVS